MQFPIMLWLQRVFLVLNVSYVIMKATLELTFYLSLLLAFSMYFWCYQFVIIWEEGTRKPKW